MVLKRRRGLPTCNKVCVIAGIALFIAICSVTMGIIALVYATSPTGFNMGLMENNETQTRRRSERCPYGSETLIFYIDTNSNTQFDPQIDTLLYQQEICKIDTISTLLETTTEEHDEFRGKDQILATTTKNLDDERVEMKQDMSSWGTRTVTLEGITTDQSSKMMKMCDYDEYLNGRLTVLEEKDILRFQRLTNLEHLITNSSIEASTITVNLTDTLNALSEHAHEDEYKFAELQVFTQQLQYNYSSTRSIVGELEGSVSGLLNLASSYELWKDSVTENILDLHQADITTGNRVDQLQLNHTETKVALFQHVNNIASHNLRLNTVEILSNELKTDLTALYNNVGQKIREFSYVQSNQTSIWQRLNEHDQIKNIVLGFIANQTEVNDELSVSTSQFQILNISIAEALTDINAVSSQLATLSGFSETNGNAISTIVNTLSAREILYNATIDNVQGRMVNFDSFLQDHEMRLTLAEQNVANNQAITAINTARVSSILQVQNQHNLQLTNLTSNVSKLLSDGVNLSDRLMAVEHSNRLLYLDLQQLKIENNNSGSTSTSYNNTITVDLEARIQTLEAKECNCSYEPTPTTTNYGPQIIMHGYAMGDGTFSKTYNSSVVRTGVGQYTITFDSALNTKYYTILLQPEDGELLNDVQMHVISSSRGYNSVSVNSIRQDAGNNKNKIPYEDRSFSYQIIN